MYIYILKRLLISIPQILVMTFLVYLIITWSGQSAFDKFALDPSADPHQIAQMKREAHLDKPAVVRYLYWLRGVCFDLRLTRERHPLADFEATNIADRYKIRTEKEGSDLSFDAVQKGEELVYGSALQIRFPETERDAAHLESLQSPHPRRDWPAGNWDLSREDLPETETTARTEEPIPLRSFLGLEMELQNPSEDRPVSFDVVIRDGAGSEFVRPVTLSPKKRKWIGVPLPQIEKAGVDLKQIRSIGFRGAGGGTVRVDEIRLIEDQFPIRAGVPDFGSSFEKKQPVLALIADRVLNTVQLTVGAILLTWLIALPIGIYGAIRQYSLGDKVFSFVAYIGMAMPSFFLAILVIFGARLLFYEWSGPDNPFHEALPTYGRTSQGHEEMGFFGRLWDIAWHSILPICVIAAAGMAGLMRVMRANMLDVKSQLYVTAARAKGVSERMIIYKHCLRNAILPFVAGFGSILPALIGGSAFVEIVFSYPGIGREMLNAVQSVDINVIMASTFIVGLLLIAGNILADILLAVVDPRISYT